MGKAHPDYEYTHHARHERRRRRTPPQWRDREIQLGDELLRRQRLSPLELTEALRQEMYRRRLERADRALPVSQAAAALMEYGRTLDVYHDDPMSQHAPSECFSDVVEPGARRRMQRRLELLGYRSVEEALMHVEMRTTAKWVWRNIHAVGIL